MTLNNLNTIIMNNYTSRLIEILSGLRCPVCGKFLEVRLTHGDCYSTSYCHKELGELCDKTEQAFATANKLGNNTKYRF